MGDDVPSFSSDVLIESRERRYLSVYLYGVVQSDEIGGYGLACKSIVFCVRNHHLLLLIYRFGLQALFVGGMMRMVRQRMENKKRFKRLARELTTRNGD